MWKNILVFLFAFGCGYLCTIQFESNGEFSTSTDTFNPPVNENRELFSPKNDEDLLQPVEDRFFMPTSKSDAEVVAFFEKFRQAVAEGDRKMISSMTTNPVCVRFAHGDENRKGCRLLTSAQLMKNYTKIFDSDYKQFIANIDTEKKGQLGVLWANWRGVTADRGQFWFGGICLDKNCGKTELKFTTLSSGFLQRPYDQKNHVDNP